MHRGHVCLIEQLKAAAAERGLQPWVYFFENHPMEVINPAKTPKELTGRGLTEHFLAQRGVTPKALTFSYEMQQLTAAEFLKKLKQEGVKLLMMGFNNSIGADRLRGDSPELKKAAESLGIEIILAKPLEGEAISSTAIREALDEGDIEHANRMLGRPFGFTGRVVYGQQLGRTIGFPTANVETHSGMQLPKPGVYAGEVLGHKAVINVGRRPTVATDAPINVEAHLLDFSGDLYGRNVDVTFLHRLRDEQKFSSIDALKHQIRRDIENANL